MSTDQEKIFTSEAPRHRGVKEREEKGQAHVFNDANNDLITIYHLKTIFLMASQFLGLQLMSQNQT